jgi:hypothetical protein
VNANIALARGLTKKVVSIKPITDSDLPADYVLDSVKTTPDKILITGDPQVISTVNFLDTEKIALAKMTSSGQKTVKLVIPDGITVSKDTVDVTITVSAKKLDKN